MSETGSLLSGLTSLADAKTRSISPENFHGEKGRGGMAVEGTGKECARQLGQGWKISPSVEIAGKELLVLADIEGSGIIQHIWLTCPHEDWRSLVYKGRKVALYGGAYAPSYLPNDVDTFACGVNCGNH